MGDGSPGHALAAGGAESVEGDSDAHGLVADVAVSVTEEHNLVVVVEPVVGDGDVGGAAGDVDEAVLARVQRVVVDPHLGGRHHPDGIAVLAAGVR